MKKRLATGIVLTFILIAIGSYLALNRSDGFVRIHIKNAAKWGEEFDLKYTKYIPPIGPNEIKDNKNRYEWVEAYSVNSDLRKVDYDAIVKNATKDCLIERGLDSRESFEEKKRVIDERIRTSPIENPPPKKYVLWSSEIILKGDKYMLICTAREGHLSDLEAERKYKSMVLLRFDGKWRLESYKKGIDLGLVAFPWNDGKNIEEIYKQKMAEFKDGLISVGGPK
jgi:hypothetical protein